MGSNFKSKALGICLLGLGMVIVSYLVGYAPSYADSQQPDQPLPSYCAKPATGDYDAAAITMDKGKSPTPDKKFVWAQGGGCVTRAIREAWAVLHNYPEFPWEYTKVDYANLSDAPPAGATHLYDVRYVLQETPSVFWNMKWLHQVSQGDKKDPRHVVIQYEKVSGVEFIRYWKGVIELTELENNVTGISVRSEVDAEQTADKDIARAMKDLIKKVRSGVPNWGPLN